MTLAWIVLSLLFVGFPDASSGSPCENLNQAASYGGEGKCFWLHTTQLNFSDGLAECQKASSHYTGSLAEPRTQLQWNVLTTIVRSSNVPAWLGATDEAEEGVWLWATDKQRMNVSSDWLVHGLLETYFGSKLQDCALLTTHLVIDDHSCIEKATSLCQAATKSYSHSYLAALPEAALAGHDHALLSASSTSLYDGWVFAEVTTYPSGQIEIKSFSGNFNGLNYQLDMTQFQSEDYTRGSLMVRSTSALHLVLVLWSQDLTRLSSSLIMPYGVYSPTTSLFSHLAAAAVNLGSINIVDPMIALRVGDSRVGF
ncbi:hypothetical protein PoB_001179500 [Plakobranchus ocellatus]|uniref:C-type lectin domain-containing protein n=1 Tax=Plakobranchus ocellatus TaxID=259542 RepID=A0AAV3YRA9_9GAST|nr:hypothetical protein PoB_001179500 [Plakobranchus ocellatus]